MSDKLPRMDYRQHRRARRLVHELSLIHISEPTRPG